MLWVRFPNGQCIQYNRANYCVTDSTGRRLWTSKAASAKNEGIVAVVPLDCVVEFQFACSVSNPLDKAVKGDSETARELRSLKRKVDRIIKGSK
jgi:hypothetical protein